MRVIPITNAKWTDKEFSTLKRMAKAGKTRSEINKVITTHSLSSITAKADKNGIRIKADANVYRSPEKPKARIVVKLNHNDGSAVFYG